MPGYFPGVERIAVERECRARQRCLSARPRDRPHALSGVALAGVATYKIAEVQRDVAISRRVAVSSPTPGGPGFGTRGVREIIAAGQAASRW